jgi:hypothetical protein
MMNFTAGAQWCQCDRRNRSIRSPDRPKPRGPQRVTVREVVRNRLRIGPIEAIDEILRNLLKTISRTNRKNARVGGSFTRLGHAHSIVDILNAFGWELIVKRAIAAAALFVFAGALIGTAQSVPPSTNISPQPIKVEITRQSEPQSSRDKLVTLIGQVAWPIVAVFAAFLFRKPLTSFLDTVAKRATKFSIGALGIELPTMNEAQLGDDL